MENTFTGKLTEIRTPRTGTNAAGLEWAKAEFEVTEINPQNELYLQIALFDFFKNGEHVKFAKDFNTYYKLGDVVTVHFNFKANDYTNDKGENVKFYKTSAWKVEKMPVSETQTHPEVSFEPEENDPLF